MSRRDNGKGPGIFWIIIALIILANLGTFIRMIAGVAVVGVILAIMAFFIALLVVLIKKMSAADKEAQRTVNNQNNNRGTVNPYSKGANTVNNRTAQNNSTVVQGKTPPYGVTQVQKPTPVYREEVKSVQEPAKPVRQSTGDAEIDKMIADRDMAIQEMHRLNHNIEDPKLSAQIDHLEDVTNKIMNYVIAHPKKKKQVVKFFNFYLPTTLKLLNSYDRMDDTGISGANIDGTKGKVENMMEMALSAFDKQLDSLFAEEALDVSTDISVMASMLRAEGLTDDELMKEAIEAAKVIADEKPESVDDFLAGLGEEGFGGFGEETTTSSTNE